MSHSPQLHKVVSGVAISPNNIVRDRAATSDGQLQVFGDGVDECTLTQTSIVTDTRHDMLDLRDSISQPLSRSLVMTRTYTMSPEGAEDPVHTRWPRYIVSREGTLLRVHDRILGIWSSLSLNSLTAYQRENLWQAKVLS